MEQIQNHPIQDIWRIKHGLLVVIDKYVSISNRYYYSSDMKAKVVRGCKGLRELKEGYMDLPKGTFLFGRTAVEPTKDKNKFRVEIKSSGGTISGTIPDVVDVLEDIDTLLSKYQLSNYGR